MTTLSSKSTTEHNIQSLYCSVLPQPNIMNSFVYELHSTYIDLAKCTVPTHRFIGWNGQDTHNMDTNHFFGM